MQEVVAWFHGLEGRMHAVELAARLHYRFILIHPFLDGNGRTARLLTNFVLLRAGYTPAVIRAEEHRREYIDALRAVDASVPLDELRPDHQGLEVAPFIRYVEREVLWSLDRALDVVEGRIAITPEDLVRRFVRIEKSGVEASGLAPDDEKLRAMLDERVRQVTRRADGFLSPIAAAAHSVLRETRVEARSSMETPRGALSHATHPRRRTVSREGVSIRGQCGLVQLFIRSGPVATVLNVPENFFEVLVAAEPHRIDVWAVRACMLEKGWNFEQQPEPSRWSAHLSLPVDPVLARDSDLGAFLVEQTDKFLALVQPEIMRRAGQP